MAKRDGYRAQIELLIRSLPAVASAPDFALKGGTAINLFLRNMPRLSVDIDLTYLPVSDRDTAPVDIRAQLAAIADALKRTVPGVNVQLVEGAAPKLFVNRSDARVKIEPSVVIRGSLVPPVQSELYEAAQEAYELFVEIPRLDSADLYAGKLCASLDRQHPRDLFDVMHLQAAGAIPDSIRQAFVAYLAGHRRPIAELLQPNRKPIGVAPLGPQIFNGPVRPAVQPPAHIVPRSPPVMGMQVAQEDLVEHAVRDHVRGDNSVFSIYSIP